MAEATTNYPTIRDKAVIAAAAEYVRHDAARKAAEKRQKELKPALLTAMGDAPIAHAGTHVLRRTDVAKAPDAPDITITRAMVGQVLPGKKGRAGYTTLEVI